MSAGDPRSTGEPGNTGPRAGEPGSAGARAAGHRATRPDTAVPPTLMGLIVGSSLRFRHLVVAAEIGRAHV